jgi:hypothetical protein
MLVIGVIPAINGCACTKGIDNSSIGTIQIPDGPKIKVIFNGPSELKAAWEKVGMAADGFQMQMIGTLTNTSDQAVTFSVAFLLDSQQVDYLPTQTLDPGETVKIAKGFACNSEENKTLEIKIENLKKSGFSVSTNTITITGGEEVYIKAPKNPETAEEVLAAFYFLCSNGEYSKAEKLCTENFLWDISYDAGDLKTAWERMFKGCSIIKIIIDKEQLCRKSDQYVGLNATIYFTDRDPRSLTCVGFEKIDGKWKLDQ